MILWKSNFSSVCTKQQQNHAFRSQKSILTDNHGRIGLLVRLGQRLDLAPQSIAKVIDGLAAADQRAAVIDGHATVLGIALTGRGGAVPRPNVVGNAVDDPGQIVVLQAVLPAADGPRPGHVGDGHDAVVLIIGTGAGEVHLGLEGRAAADGLDQREARGVGKAQVFQNLDARLGDEALAFREVGAGVGLEMTDDVRVGVFEGGVVHFGDDVVILLLDGPRVVGRQETRVDGGRHGEGGGGGGKELHACDLLLGYFRLRRIEAGQCFVDRTRTRMKIYGTRYAC